MLQKRKARAEQLLFEATHIYDLWVSLVKLPFLRCQLETDLPFLNTPSKQKHILRTLKQCKAAKPRKYIKLKMNSEHISCRLECLPQSSLTD